MGRFYCWAVGHPRKSLLLTSVLESCCDLSGQTREGLINTFGESPVHSPAGFIITEETRTLISNIQ